MAAKVVTAPQGRSEPDHGSAPQEPAGSGSTLRAEIPGRYSRQILFEGIGQDGQARLIASRVVLVGCGALGTVQASLLVRAGIGVLRIIDRDFVEESNLQRQVLFDEEDVRRRRHGMRPLDVHRCL